jgi:hypothetical protein
MCLADLYDVEPKRRVKLARLENITRMRDAVREADSLMSAAMVEVQPPPCAETVVAGAYQEKAA